jgi:hypothetical protein
MRRIVLSQDYRKVWIVELDVIPPIDALKRLLEVDAPIASGLYALRHGDPQPNLWRWEGRNLGRGMTWDEVREAWGKTIRVSGACMGCLLVDSDALRDFSFLTGEHGAPDIRFMTHCCEKGFLQTAGLDVVCGHKEPSGNIVWPDLENNWRLEYANAA